MHTEIPAVSKRPRRLVGAGVAWLILAALGVASIWFWIPSGLLEQPIADSARVWAILLAVLAVCGICVTAGVALLRRRRWARPLGMVLSILLILPALWLGLVALILGWGLGVFSNHSDLIVGSTLFALVCAVLPAWMLWAVSSRKAKESLAAPS